MSGDGFKLQVNVKVGNDLINVRADDPQELERLLADLPHAAIAEARAALTGVANAAPLANIDTRNGQTGQEHRSLDVPPTSAAAPAAAPVTAIGQKSTTDNYGNTYDWNLPGAPGCSHGIRPRKTGLKKDQTQYQAWVCAQLRGAVIPGLKATEGACPIQYID